MKHGLSFLPALPLALIFIALTWRFLLGIGLLALSILAWVLLLTFCIGAIQGFRETTEKRSVT